MGKFLGAVIGFVTLGFAGAIVGLFVGHFFDVGRSRLKAQFSPEQRARVEAAFSRALFPILGQLAKADGRVSEEEIQSVEELIKRMGLSDIQRAEAIQLFQKGKVEQFSLRDHLREFNEACEGYADAKRIFIVYLITLALADGVLHPNEEALLSEVAEQISFSRFAFNQILGMVRAQMAFRERHAYQDTGYSSYRRSEQRESASGFHDAKQELNLAYQALGMTPNDTDAAIKKAYRKLMSQNHPDKLAGRGVPEDMVRLATERSQEIQKAYELVKKSRK